MIWYVSYLLFEPLCEDLGREIELTFRLGLNQHVRILRPPRVLTLP